MGRTYGRRLSERHIRAAHEVLTALQGATYEDTLARISALEEADRRCFRHPLSLQVANRSTSDLRLTAARFHRRPIEECEALLAQRLPFGFPDLYHEALCIAAHALYCERMSNLDEARRHLRDLVRKVDEACARGEDFDTKYANFLRNTLAELEG